MNDEVLFPRSTVTDVLVELLGALEPGPLEMGQGKARAERVCAVGGYRRGKEQMKDLELLYIPKTREEVDPGDMFGHAREVDATETVWAELVERGVLEPRLGANGTKSWGQRIKLARHIASGLPVDLFAATRENWHNLMVVRTGPKYLNVLVATYAKRHGWDWEVSEAGFVPVGKTWETATKDRRTMRSEREVFTMAGLDCVPPEHRAEYAQRFAHQERKEAA